MRFDYRRNQQQKKCKATCVPQETRYEWMEQGCGNRHRDPKHQGTQHFQDESGLFARLSFSLSESQQMGMTGFKRWNGTTVGGFRRGATRERLIARPRADASVATRRGSASVPVRGLKPTATFTCRAAAWLQCKVAGALKPAGVVESNSPVVPCLSFLTCHLLPTDLAELLAADDRLYRGADPVLVRFQLVAHLGNERAVRDQHAAAQRIAE